uniref:Uncharacterized protein n=1 Tax=Anguilla anguilla TaxID=7936 RepID=A0A0E9W670_ANGAN
MLWPKNLQVTIRRRQQ